MTDLQTPRLSLIRFTRARMLAAIEGNPALQRCLGGPVADDWPNPDIHEALPFFAELCAATPAFEEWIRLVVLRGSGTVIGDIGFKGLPDASGSVEIGYGIAPSRRGQGHATEAAEAMIAWALGRPDVRCVTASCLADNHASVRVLERCGMQRLAGTVVREGEGEMLSFALEAVSR